MQITERIKDIQTTDHFNEEELEHIEDALYPSHTFKSWEYYLIYHFTNEELYYMDEKQTAFCENTSDLNESTPKGKIYCFK